MKLFLRIWHESGKRAVFNAGTQQKYRLPPLYPALCAEITGQSNAWDIISGLADKTGLVIRIDRDTYRFHALLKEFLENCKKIMPLLTAAPAGRMTFFSITNNFPFFHKAQIDYTGTSVRLDEFVTKD